MSNLGDLQVSDYQHAAQASEFTMSWKSPLTYLCNVLVCRWSVSLKDSFAARLILLALFFLCLPLDTARGQSRAQSIESFVQLKSKWPDLVGSQFLLEGRYSLANSELIKFENCDLFFHAKTELPKLSGLSSTVEVTGKIAREKNRLYFAIEKLVELPNDLETFRFRRAKLSQREAAPWYELGDWATGRAKFYNDQELAKRADIAYLQGLNIERRSIKDNDTLALIKLSEKAKKYRQPEPIRRMWLHEAHVITWEKHQKAKTLAPLEQLTSDIARDLPGATTPLRPPQPKLRKKYNAEPLATYRDASNEERTALHRILYTEVVLKTILAGAQADGSNGFVIAAAIDDQIPEKHQLAESFREQELEFRLTNVARASRREAIELSELFRNREQPEQARQALASWLNARQTLVRREGPAGLIPLSKEYIKLLEDEATAAKLLMEAHRRIPDSKEVASELTRLGYRLTAGVWLTASQAEALPVDPLEKAAREGQVVKDMSPDQVRRALAGAPNAVTRSASAGHISETWIYGERTGSRIAVHFLRRSRQTPADARVVGISQVPAR